MSAFFLLFQAFMISLFGFISSILFSSPLFAFTKIESIFTDASYCYEEWPPHISKIAYVYTCTLVQHVIPSVFIIYAYYRIYKKLKNSTKRTKRFSTKVFIVSEYGLLQFYLQDYRKINRRRRTNLILTIICTVFFVTLAPLNILNVIINTKNTFQVK